MEEWLAAIAGDEGKVEALDFNVGRRLVRDYEGAVDAIVDSDEVVQGCCADI